MGVVKETNPAALKVAQEFAKKVHELVPDAVVKLFGSAVRGEMEELSDAQNLRRYVSEWRDADYTGASG